MLTIGHSTRSLEEFVQLLKQNKAEKVVDVRTIPKSRRNPQFNSETLSESLRQAGIGYIHMAGLGGLRHARRDSLNTAWYNMSFQGFADYMQTAEFEKSLKELLDNAAKERVALMCAEAVPWRCHRSLIADALTVRGFKVEHIVGVNGSRPHRVTPWAEIDGTKITYPLSKLSALEVSKSYIQHHLEANAGGDSPD